MISLHSIKSYFNDVENHQDELTEIKKKLRKNEIEDQEAERQNT